LNSYADILARLRHGVGGGFSTLEGTFAGDVLGAVASELARIYAQEFDAVTDRAFVATAVGGWLDAACGDYGMSRKVGESDDSLRQRTLSMIRLQASSGNEAHYKTWAEELEGVSAAQARGRVRGPGTVDVYIIPGDPEAGDALLERVHGHIEGLRPVCADVAVSYARPMDLEVTGDLVLASGASVESVTARFSAALTEYLARTALSEQGSLISLTRVAGLLMDCDGVLDARNLKLNGVAGSLQVPSGSYAVAARCAFEPAVGV